VIVPSIVLEDIGLVFEDGKQLFDGLSITTEAGHCTCILGPSGCGKSTLLKLISGSREFPFDGTISFDPDPVTAFPCAWMGQNDLLLPWMSLLDNVLLGSKLRGDLVEGLKDQARHLLHESGLADYERALPRALSGGMRQRGALLRTLMEDRPVLLMDEPFSALDSLTRVKLQNLSSHLTRGATVLLVTHDPFEALRMANRIVVLDGTPARIRTEIRLTGPVPRSPDSPEVVGNYGQLMRELLQEGTT
jgi:putative hydroxymethylpyrimidine transport system ATP-binding protein